MISMLSIIVWGSCVRLAVTTSTGICCWLERVLIVWLSSLKVAKLQAYCSRSFVMHLV